MQVPGSNSMQFKYVDEKVRDSCYDRPIATNKQKTESKQRTDRPIANNKQKTKNKGGDSWHDRVMESIPHRAS